MSNRFLIAAVAALLLRTGWGLEVSTNIFADTTWSTNDSPVVITWSGFKVDTNATLTIDPGVTVRISGNFTVNGQLRALGTAAQPISFEGTNSVSKWGPCKFDKAASDWSLKTNMLSYAVLTNLQSYIYISQQTVSFSNCVIRIEGGQLSSYGLAAYVNTAVVSLVNARLTFVSNDVVMASTYDSGGADDLSFISLDGFPSEFRDNTFVFTATGRWSAIDGVVVDRSNTQPTWSHWSGNRIVLTNSADFAQDVYGLRYVSSMSGLVSNNQIRMVIPRGARGIAKYDNGPIVGNTVDIESFGGGYGYLYGIRYENAGVETNEILINNRINLTTDRPDRYLYGIYGQAGRQRQNRITTRNDATNGTQTGIYNMYYGCRIEANSILQYAANTGTTYGIYVADHYNPNSIVSLYNNLVQGPGTNGRTYGIYIDTNSFSSFLTNGYNLVWNVATNYVDCPVGPGDLITDPLLADTNFHLSLSSPAIDAGTNLDWMGGAVDMDNNPRIARSRADIGAHEVQQTATPVIAPTGGVYLGAVTVTLTCATSGATNYYTLNGSEPSTNSTAYATTFTLTNSATVKAMASRTNLLDSAVTSAVFTVYGTNQVLLTIQSAYDSPSPTNGTYVYTRNQSVTCLVADTAVTLGTTQYVAAGWSLSGHAATNGVSTGITAIVVLIMTNNATLTWQWTTNFYFTVTSSAGGATTGSTSGWYSSGAAIAVTAVPNVHFHFLGWSGDTQGDTNSPAITVSLNGPRTLTAHFTVDTYTLSVISSYGSPAPAPGIYTNGYGSTLTNTITGSPAVNGGTQFVCAGWSMSGNAPVSGASLSFSMTLTNDSVLSWLWQTNYLLTVEADTGGAVTGAASGWRVFGTSVVIQAVPDANFDFSGWSGDTQGDTNASVMTLLMDRGRWLKAHFVAEIPPPEAPEAPANVSASEGAYTDKVAIAWTGSSNTAGYEIWRDLSASNAALRAANQEQLTKTDNGIAVSAQQIGESKETSFNDTSAIPGFVYSYWVSGTNAAGRGDFSSPATGWRRCVPLALAADFDGDGLADPVVVQPATGTWRIRSSLADYAIFNLPTILGAPGELPLAADFDGDNLADGAVWRPETGHWRLKLSGAGYTLLEFSDFAGITNGLPLAADFDGDRKADPAIVSTSGTPSTGSWQVWTVWLSADGYSPASGQFLPPTAYSLQPITADFDGDRFSDPAAYEWATGTWRIRLSRLGYQVSELLDLLGGDGYAALAADFDGDRFADPAVFDPSTGNWIILLSGSGYYRAELREFLNDR